MPAWPMPGTATAAAIRPPSRASSISAAGRRHSTTSAGATGPIRISATTVDRYVQEFERLLADVNRDDRDDNLTRTYLTSETGKVYTMLAHAAGRLG